MYVHKQYNKYYYHMSRVVGKPDICICEKLGTDQRYYTCAADQFHSLAKIYMTFSSNVKSDQDFSMHI